MGSITELTKHTSSMSYTFGRCPSTTVARQLQPGCSVSPPFLESIKSPLSLPHIMDSVRTVTHIWSFSPMLEYGFHSAFLKYQMDPRLS